MNFRRFPFLFILMSLFSRNICAQELSASEIREIKDLYCQGDFEVMKQMILAKGFVLTKDIQEYTADRNNYKNVYNFTRNAFVTRFKDSYNEIQITDKLSFETIDRDFYKYVSFEFSLNCELCDTRFLSDMDWHYKNVESMKPTKDRESEFRHELEFETSDSLWAEDLTDPGHLWNKFFFKTVKMQYDYVDLGLLLPYHIFSGKYYLDIPYSPIDCSIEEYYKRQKLKQKFTVPITQSNGSYYVFINVGGVLIKYLIDSGASVVTIDPKTEAKLLKSGIITKQNYLTSSTFQLADGSSKQFKRVTIPWLVIKGIKVNNVTAAIMDEGSTLLLGKSFLDKFSYWKIDNIKNTLELQKK